MKYFLTKESGNWLNDWNSYFNSFFNDELAIENQFAVDIVKKEKSYQLIADLPGFSQEEVEIRLENQILTIQAKQVEEKKEAQEEKPTFIRQERIQKNFKRLFKLPDDINSEGITAKMNNGTLVLDLPFSEAKQPKMIEIKSA